MTRRITYTENSSPALYDALAQPSKHRPLSGWRSEVVHRWDPHLLICSPPIPPNPINTRESWVELSLDPERPSRVCLSEQRWETLNPSLEELLSVVDEAEKKLVE